MRRKPTLQINSTSKFILRWPGNFNEGDTVIYLSYWLKMERKRGEHYFCLTGPAILYNDGTEGYVLDEKLVDKETFYSSPNVIAATNK